MPLRNAAKILRGAFVEYGLSIPPLFVVFQFNPLELTRAHSLSFAPPNTAGAAAATPAPAPAGAATTATTTAATPPAATAPATGRSLREWHKTQDDLMKIQADQVVTVQEETISLEIRLDATDKLEAGDPIAATFGVLPQLATLELMVAPKEESLLGAALGDLLGSPGGFSLTKRTNPPLVLFIWGYKRVLPVNITSMSIRETEFSTLLDPVRATVSVSMTVIEGKNPLYKVSKVAKEVSSVLNLANLADLVHVVVPG